MKRILIIGAGFLQSFVIRRAKELGYYTLAVDANPAAEGFSYADEHSVISIVDQEACLAYAREKQIHGVLTAATDYGVLTASYIAQELGLPGIPYEAAKRIKNKYQTRRCLYEHAVDDTALAYEVTQETDLAELAVALTYPVMVKPCDGSGSRGASRVDAPDGLALACGAAMAASLTRRALIERFITGQEYGAETLVVDGQPHVLAIMKKWMTSPPYYAELGHAVPSGLPGAVEKHARECVERAVQALGLTCGSVNMDLLITQDGRVHIVDIGARMGGNMIGPWIIPGGTGVDYMTAMLRNAVGEPVELTAGPHRAVATRLLAYGAGVVQRLPDFGALEAAYGVKICHHLSVGQEVSEYHTNLDGCGYVLAEADSAEAAAEIAEEVRRRIGESIFA